MRAARPAELPSEVPAAWQELAASLPQSGCVLILGATDTGKTTLCWWLAREFGTRQAVAIVDADLGQSRIGPAACVGWQRLNSHELQFYFVGATSPQAHPVSALRATVRAARAAAAVAPLVLIDTTGYLRGEGAVALKCAKIRHLRPVHVVALGEHPSYAAILGPWRDDPEVTIHRLPVADTVRVKDRESRQRWRRQCFAEWLAGSNLRWIGATGRVFRHVPPRELWDGERGSGLQGLLMGFSDGEGRGICLGLLHSVDWSGRRVLALCPPEAEGARLVEFGCIRLAPDGHQVGVI